MTKQANVFDFDEIMEITELGDQDTYDFVIPETHCFIANGFVVHNSGRIEENADNVVGLWRKDKEAEDTRLEWLKGRDVGTFTCLLKFDRQVQKFSDMTEQPVFESEKEETGYLDK